MPQETLGSPDEALRPRLQDSHLRPGGFRGGWRRGRRSAGCGRGTGPRRSHPGAGAHRTRWGGRGAPALRCAGTWLSRGALTSASDPGTPCWTRGCLWTGGVGTASDLRAAAVPASAQAPDASASRKPLGSRVSGTPRPALFIRPPVCLLVHFLKIVYSFAFSFQKNSSFCLSFVLCLIYHSFIHSFDNSIN